MKYFTTFLLFLFSSILNLVGQNRPNFILLMGDDHGWSETGYNGHAHLKTPVLDEISRTGLRMDRFYAGHPTCSPTRGSFLTGRHPVRYGTFHPGYSIRPEEITMAHLLSKSGYHCGHFGKWHLGPVKKDSPTNPAQMGFHEYVSHDNFYEMNPAMSRNGGPPEVLKGEGSEVTIEETIQFIRRSKDLNKPFLAVVWFGSPHEPYSGLQKDLDLYKNLPKEYGERTVSLTSNETGRPTSRSLRDVLQERYAEITAMDRSIGKLRQFLNNEGLQDNTLLWYCGDNGSPPSSGRVENPLRGQKATMYEGGIRVPGLIEWPAQLKANRISQVNGVTSDMLPTVCELAGVCLPERPLDGISLVPLLKGEMEKRSHPIGFWRYDSALLKKTKSPLKPYLAPNLQEGTTPLVKFMGSIRTRNFHNYHHPEITESDYSGPRVFLDNDYKLVVIEKSTELFKLDEDPAEENDISSANPEVAERLKRELRNWQSSVLKSLRGDDY